MMVVSSAKSFSMVDLNSDAETASPVSPMVAGWFARLSCEGVAIRKKAAVAAGRVRWVSGRVATARAEMQRRRWKVAQERRKADRCLWRAATVVGRGRRIDGRMIPKMIWLRTG